MSKASKKKARRKRQHRKSKAVSVICQLCGSLGDGSPATLLTNLADALNACSDAGMDVRLRHGIVIASQGYVLPMAHDRWTARALNYDAFIPVPALPEDFDD